MLVTGGCLSVLVESVSSADGAGRPRRRRRKGGLHGGVGSGTPRDGLKGPAGTASHGAQAVHETASEGPGGAVGVVGIESVPSSNGTGMQRSLPYPTNDGVIFCEFCHTTLPRGHLCEMFSLLSSCFEVLLLPQTLCENLNFLHSLSTCAHIIGSLLSFQFTLILQVFLILL